MPNDITRRLIDGEWTTTSVSDPGSVPIEWVPITPLLVNGWLPHPAGGENFGPPFYMVWGEQLWFKGGLNGLDASSNVAFTLPAEARPPYTRVGSIFNQTSFSVAPSGVVTVIAAGALYLVLDSTVFSLT